MSTWASRRCPPARPSGRSRHDPRPARRARPGAGQFRLERRAGAAQQRRPGPGRGAVRLRPLLVRRASPQSRGRRYLPGRRAGPDRRGDLDHPDRVGRGADGSPHRVVGGGGVRPDRRPASGPSRPGPGPVGRAAEAERGPGARAGATRRLPKPRRPDATGARTGCSSPSGSPSGTCSARRASRCRRRCCSYPAPSRRTTPSRSATSSPCCGAATARPTGSRRTPSPVKAQTSRSGSWAAAAGRAPRWPGRTGCVSRPTTTSARRPCWRRPRDTGPPSGPPPILTGPT